MFNYFFPNSRRKFDDNGIPIPIVPPPLNSINDPMLNYKKADDVNRLESRYKKPRFEESNNYKYSNPLDERDEIDERAKRGNKYSMITLNMGVDLARRGALPNIPENQYIFEEMNRRDNRINARANREYLQQEEIRQAEFENLQQDHASKMSERIRQHKKRTRRQQEEEEEEQRRQQQEAEERQRQEAEFEYIRQQQEERFRQAFEEQERLRREFEEEQERLYREQEKEQERLRKEQEKEAERLGKEQEKEAERLRKEQEKEAERLRKEQEKEAQAQSQLHQNLPPDIKDITKCPALKIDLPKDKSYCNKNVYKKLSLKLHPDKNKGCENYATDKFQKLTEICDGNQFYEGGKKKKTKKRNKTNKKKTKKRKQTKRNKN
jgi:hypothetical protein